MNNISLNIAPTVHEAFQAFVSDTSLFALPLKFSSQILEALPAIPTPKDDSSSSSFQVALAKLDPLVNPKAALYLIIRRNSSLTAITYIPYLAATDLKQLYLVNRSKVVETLGSALFSTTLICKEPGEILDVRSWNEREGDGESWATDHTHGNANDCEDCAKEGVADKETSFKDLGYKKNKCRLCDRRMKYPVSAEGIAALKKLANGGDCAQFAVDIDAETLVLNFSSTNVDPSQLPSHLPVEKPSFTFYRHPTTQRLYFIFCSPDSAPVKVRMMHTMAIPGLVHITPRDNGVNIDQKIEIHDPEDLVFEEGDERIGKFRSMYLLNSKKGTESRWEGMPVA